MTTLALLKAQIVRDIGRSDLTADIAAAITQVYENYKDREFYFNQTRAFTFSCVSGTYTYGAGTTATINSQTIDITDFWNIKKVWLELSNRKRPLTPVDYDIMEERYDGSESQGEPYDWSWYAETMWLYPKPNDTFTIRISGHYNVPMPATDDEADNPWMIHAYELIREETKAILYSTKINSPDRLKLAISNAARHLSILKRKTSRKMGQSDEIEGSEMPC